MNAWLETSGSALKGGLTISYARQSGRVAEVSEAEPSSSRRAWLGQATGGVVKVKSGESAVPSTVVAMTRKWYSVAGWRPVSGAVWRPKEFASPAVNWEVIVP